MKARTRDGNRAAELFRLVNPLHHSRNVEELSRYRVEPYVVAADVYSQARQVGRGGWTWYTGSAGWMYRVGIENILGLKRRGNSILVDPCIPSNWKQYRMHYRFGSTQYEITVENPEGKSRGVMRVQMDGIALKAREIPLRHDGNIHQVTVVLGEENGMSGLKSVPDIP
jgi:cellobiose phosphorylase